MDFVSQLLMEQLAPYTPFDDEPLLPDGNIPSGQNRQP
jgi:hypothetical protein